MRLACRDDGRAVVVGTAEEQGELRCEATSRAKRGGPWLDEGARTVCQAAFKLLAMHREHSEHSEHVHARECVDTYTTVWMACVRVCVCVSECVSSLCAVAEALLVPACHPPKAHWVSVAQPYDLRIAPLPSASPAEQEKGSAFFSPSLLTLIFSSAVILCCTPFSCSPSSPDAWRMCGRTGRIRCRNATTRRNIVEQRGGGRAANSTTPLSSPKENAFPRGYSAASACHFRIYHPVGNELGRKGEKPAVDRVKIERGRCHNSITPHSSMALPPPPSLSFSVSRPPDAVSAAVARQPRQPVTRCDRGWRLRPTTANI